MKRFSLVCMLLVVVVPLYAQSTLLPESFDVQGHRGARGLKPENTLPAFEIALDLRVSTLEMDLHFTADDRVVVWHDPEINMDRCRLPEDNTVELPQSSSLIFGSNSLQIRQLTLEQVQAFICDGLDNERFPQQVNSPTLLADDDYRIQTLDAVFAFVDDYSESEAKSASQRENASTIHFNIESKRNANDASVIDDGFDGEHIAPFEQAIMTIAAEYDVLERITLQSFDHRVLWAVKAAYPDVQIAALTNRQHSQFEVYADQGTEIWSPNYTQITEADIAQAHRNEILVIPWTINDPDDMLKLIEWGVDGIITDRPDILLNLQIDE